MSNKRLLITLSGCVQGVGFRPFVYRLAREHALVGHIRNTSSGVTIDVQGAAQALADFQRDLAEKKPVRASISEMKVEEALLGEAKSFEISSSDHHAKTQLALLPDTAICAECLQELYDPANRRHRYPFLHCMSCGPRFSLFVRMPFDRANTTMIDFPMCKQCQEEYGNPSDRRFYSQTNCCPTCGPKLELFDSSQNLLARQYDAIDAAVDLLRQGKIVALKNTGGFLLLVDAENEAAVNRLRIRKQRMKKPFALLMPTIEVAKQAAYIDQTAENILTSPAAPIVLLKKKTLLLQSIAFESPYYGIMLPHNALHHLLLDALKNPLVATSGNISGMPLCITQEDAFCQLSTVADAFLVHNRRIMHRMDDSIVQIADNRPMLMRRARGYIPYAIEIPANLPSPECSLGAGGHLKNSFAIAKDQRIYLSQYIGDLDSREACLSYEREVKSWESLLNSVPDLGIGDRHPDYHTSHYLQERKISTSSIQHHRAHVFSGMLDNQLSPPFFSISWDGTGLGDDQTIWGGEAFIVTEKGIDHFATLFPFRLPGSEKAVREPRRSLLGIMHTLFGSELPPMSAFSSEEFHILCAALDKKLCSPLCSSMGRLFDAASALLDGCLVSQFEGEAALQLEALASQTEKSHLSYSFLISFDSQKNLWMIEWQDLMKQMIENKMQGAPFSEMALAFHLALADLIVQLAQKSALKNVLLTGGCMQNKLLLEAAIAQLRQAGFHPFWHHQIPPNDGGLAVGQIIGKLFEDQHVLGTAG